MVDRNLMRINDYVDGDYYFYQDVDANDGEVDEDANDGDLVLDEVDELLILFNSTHLFISFGLGPSGILVLDEVDELLHDDVGLTGTVVDLQH